MMLKKILKSDLPVPVFAVFLLLFGLHLIGANSSGNKTAYDMHTLVYDNTVTVHEPDKENIGMYVGSGIITKNNTEKRFLITAGHVISNTADFIYIKFEGSIANFIKITINPGDLKKHADLDLAILNLPQHVNCTMNISYIDYNIHAFSVYQNLYSISRPLNSPELVVRNGPMFVEGLINDVAAIDMETISGDSGSAVYSNETNKILGIRTGKDPNRKYGFVVPSLHIRNMIKIHFGD